MWALFLAIASPWDCSISSLTRLLYRLQNVSNKLPSMESHGVFDDTPGKVQPRPRGSISAHFSQSLAGIVQGMQHALWCIPEQGPTCAAGAVVQESFSTCTGLTPTYLILQHSSYTVKAP